MKLIVTAAVVAAALFSTPVLIATPAMAGNYQKCDQDRGWYKWPIYGDVTRGYSGPGAAKSGANFPATPISLHDLTSGPNIAFVTTNEKVGKYFTKYRHNIKHDGQGWLPGKCPSYGGGGWWN